MIVPYIIIALAAVAVEAVPVSEESLNEFQTFKTRFNKIYKNEEEEAFRMQIYLKKSRQIIEHNKLYDEGKVSYQMGINRFSDLLHKEFQQMMLMKVSDDDDETVECELERFTKSKNNSKSLDWRSVGAVSPIKDQGSKGFCWAFSAAAAMESNYFLKTRKMVDLSEQNLVDCICREGEGGDMGVAFQYVIKRKGIDSEESYPYEEKQNDLCNYEKSKSVLSITGCAKLLPNNEEELKNALTEVGPISVSMYAADTFGSYAKGIYYSTECMYPSGINHGVLLVGYGTEKGTDYWLVKNSWGTDWGEDGYFKIARNRNSHCLIAADSVYPISD